MQKLTEDEYLGMNACEWAVVRDGEYPEYFEDEGRARDRANELAELKPNHVISVFKLDCFVLSRIPKARSYGLPMSVAA